MIFASDSQFCRDCDWISKKMIKFGTLMSKMIPNGSTCHAEKHVLYVIFISDLQFGRDCDWVPTGYPKNVSNLMLV